MKLLDNNIIILYNIFALNNTLKRREQMMRFLDEKAGKTSVQLEALINKDELALNNFYVKFCYYKKDIIE